MLRYNSCVNILSQLGVTLPIVIAILGAAWLQNRRIDVMDASLNKRIDDLALSLNKQIDEIKTVLRDMQAVLKDLVRRVTILEERTGPIVRR